jgi:hypothetical protein
MGQWGKRAGTVDLQFGSGRVLELAERGCHLLVQLIPGHVVWIRLALVNGTDNLAYGPHGLTANCFGHGALRHQEDR